MGINLNYTVNHINSHLDFYRTISLKSNADIYYLLNKNNNLLLRKSITLPNNTAVCSNTVGVYHEFVAE